MTLDIDPVAMERYRSGFRQREEQRREDLAERLQQLRDGAAAAAEVLKREYGATRVMLVGSAAHGRGVHDRSDIDLAVEGISARDFWAAGAAAERASGFELDLIDLAFARPSLAAHIEETGVEL